MNNITIFQHFVELLITGIFAIIASGGFWLYIDKKTSKKDATCRLVMGLAHDRIIYLCLKYIDRGFITQDEYENLTEYLYKPYIDLDGNGSAIRLMKEIDKLPIFNQQHHIHTKLGEKKDVSE